MFKNTASQKLAIFAWNAATGAAKTGDALNITAQISKDGAACAATNDVNPTELDAVDAPGVYIFDLLQAETNADLIVLSAVSSTADIEIRPVIIYTIPAYATAVALATAQADLDLLTGTDGATLATLQGNYAPNTVVPDAAGTAPTADEIKTAIEAAGSHLALIKAVTDALTSAAATKLALSAGTMVTGTVSHDNTAATTTVFYCDDITEATANHYNGRIVIFTSDDLQYQATDIVDYELSAGEGKFTVTALTEAPADNVTFIII